MTWRYRHRAAGRGAAGLPAEALGAQAGYSLAELLVVLAVIGLILAVVPLGVSRMLPGARLAATAEALADTLRTARTGAIESGAETGYRVEGSRLIAVGGAGPVELNGVTSLEYRAPSPSGEITRQDMFRFLPDGSSTGGYFLLKRKGRERRVAVHWLFGHVEVQQGRGAS